MIEIKFRLLLKNKIVGYERHIFCEKKQEVVIQHCEIMQNGKLGEWFDIQNQYITACVPHDNKDQYIQQKDKNGKEIYDGDVIKYYGLKRYTQQSHSDINPEIDELYIKKYIQKVVIVNGIVTTEENKDDEYFCSLEAYGLHDIDEVKDQIFGEQRKNTYTEDEMICDCDGNDINESIIGIEVIEKINEKKGITEMRELKCRAWDKKSKRYYYSGTDFNKLPLVEMPISLNNGGMIWPDVIEWYVGMKDVNDKEMYEGDVIQNNNGVWLLIYWNEKDCQFRQKVFNERNVIENGFEFDSNDVTDIPLTMNFKTVIGNLRENPELSK